MIFMNTFLLATKKLESLHLKLNYVANLNHLGGTRTDLALKMAEEELFCAECGIRGDGVPKVLIVITDGKSSIGSIPMTDATRQMKVCSSFNPIFGGGAILYHPRHIQFYTSKIFF